MEDDAHCRVLSKNMTAETEGTLENLRQYYQSVDKT